MICLCFQVVIGVPNAMQRLSILKAHTQSLKLSEDVDLAHVAELMLGYVGADIASLCREAAFVALKRMINHNNNGNRDSLSVQETLKDSEGKVIEFWMEESGLKSYSILYPHSTSLQLIEVGGRGGGVKCLLDWLNSDSHSITDKEII